ncbi:hypothetical protein XENORESO_010916 [Xenotaenia resolanae]|uniref:Uncharacterized protein n=1 Tax=Xenotaenia resolanae TaxID=208358 RepID=A0ABV0X9K9_9TELE
MDSRARHPKHSADHSVGCATCQPEKKNQGLNSSTPSMSPILVQKIKQHCQRLPAQPKIRPGVLLVEETFQDWDTQVDPAVKGSGLEKGRMEMEKHIIFKACFWIF